MTPPRHGDAIMSIPRRFVELFLVQLITSIRMSFLTQAPIARFSRGLSAAPEAYRVGVVGLGLMGHGIAQVISTLVHGVVAWEPAAD